MFGLVVIVALVSTVIVGTLLGRRYRVGPPVLLIFLGSLLGLLTALMLLPSLILTSTIPSASTASALDLFTLQSTPPAHMVLAPSLALVIGALIFLGVLTLIFMYRASSRLVLAQTLRLNQD